MYGPADAYSSDETTDGYLETKPPVYFVRTPTITFQVSKDNGGTWLKASIAVDVDGKQLWLDEWLHNFGNSNIFRLYQRTGDPKIPIMVIARRNSTFPVGCDVRLG